jgi:2-oxoglutarate dehydrogenase E1 component
MTHNTLFDSQNEAYAQAMFEEYARNPESVPPEWREIFRSRKTQAAAVTAAPTPQHSTPAAAPAAAGAVAPREPASDSPAAPAEKPAGAEPASTHGGAGAHEHLRRVLPVVSRAAALVQAFRDHGHQLARVDPLGGDPPGHPQLSPAFFGTSMEELAELPASLVLDDSAEGQSVADALAELRDVYAGSIGYEFEHVDDHVKVDWLWD